MQEVNTGPLELKPGVNCDKFAFIGSQVIPGAAGPGSDIDVAVLLIEGADPAELDSVIMMELNGENGGSAGASNDGMESYKVEDDKFQVWNYLVFTDPNYFWSFINATTICRRFGVVDKPLRVELFQLLCDGARYKDGHFEHVEIHQATPGVPF